MCWLPPARLVSVVDGPSLPRRGVPAHRQPYVFEVAEIDYAVSQTTPGEHKRWLPPPFARAAAASRLPRTCYGRVTGPLALMTWWKATGALVCEHLPALLRAPMARML